ncbi:hypothetical protein PR048_028927 [Dryococelus australis]|uniref:Uncharacterized protein n=1 Tax=Dryococelus australis TaxID=614101 RepID=A0ABQ9GBY6_9NEOP|nr:hypothetical protein PR048_028927 [Dryococelus australis]
MDLTASSTVLARHWSTAVGVDLSTSMVRRRLLRAGLFIRHALDDSEPISHLQRTIKQVPYYHVYSKTGYSLEQQPMNKHLSLQLFFPIMCSLASHQAESDSIPGRVIRFRKWESCRTMLSVGGSSRGSPVSPAPSFRRCSIFTSITLIGSQDLADNRWQHDLCRRRPATEHRFVVKTQMSRRWLQASDATRRAASHRSAVRTALRPGVTMHGRIGNQTLNSDKDLLRPRRTYRWLCCGSLVRAELLHRIGPGGKEEGLERKGGGGGGGIGGALAGPAAPLAADARINGANAAVTCSCPFATRRPAELLPWHAGSVYNFVRYMQDAYHNKRRKRVTSRPAFHRVGQPKT